MKIIFILIAILAIFALFGCTKIKQPDEVFCTEDALICPDGTAVGRIGPNCEFASCSNCTCPSEIYLLQGDSCIPKCSIPEYLGAPVCNLATIKCTINQLVGNDADEHGCIGSAGYSWCEEKQKCLRPWEEKCEEVVCTMEYAPVCVEVQVQCIRAPCDPIKQTFSNKCMAEAQNAIILYEGECLEEDTQIANPASVNCIDNNGTLEIIDTDNGQVGMCTLPSGNVCEEWAFFRNECE